jgi:hypothetical protein
LFRGQWGDCLILTDFLAWQINLTDGDPCLLTAQRYYLAESEGNTRDAPR